MADTRHGQDWSDCRRLGSTDLAASALGVAVPGSGSARQSPRGSLPVRRLAPPRPAGQGPPSGALPSSRSFLLSSRPATGPACAHDAGRGRIATSAQAKPAGEGRRFSIKPQMRNPLGSADRRDGIAILSPGLLVVAERGRAVLAVADRADPRSGNT